MKPIDAIPLRAIEGARARLAGVAIRTPLVPLERSSEREVYLKLECLQPLGSFKLRGAENALALVDPARLAAGVWTASAGNMAQGVALAAQRRGLPCRVLVPEGAPRTKIEATERLGARTFAVPRSVWWRALVEHAFSAWPAADGSGPEWRGRFIHPVSDPDVIAGNGTIGLEILEDLPELDTVLVPYGGGGLLAGIASALRGKGSQARVVACETSTAAPLRSALAAGRPVVIETRPSFVDGIGASSVLEEMWPLVSRLAAGSIVVSPAEIAEAIRHLCRRAHVVAEGAGAAPLAAIARAEGLGRRVVCVISGGNLDAVKLARILQGDVPE